MAFFGPLSVAQTLRSLREQGHFLVSCRAAMAVVAALAMPAGVQARSDSVPDPVVVSLATLPAQAQQTHRLILAGGPFPYSKDGSVFGNRERRLPRQARGYYREYTVPTPGSRDRGARRIVCGGVVPRSPETCFYSDDHYTSFRRLVP